MGGIEHEHHTKLENGNLSSNLRVHLCVKLPCFCWLVSRHVDGVLPVPVSQTRPGTGTELVQSYNPPYSTFQVHRRADGPGAHRRWDRVSEHAEQAEFVPRLQSERHLNRQLPIVPGTEMEGRAQLLAHGFQLLQLVHCRS